MAIISNSNTFNVTDGTVIVDQGSALVLPIAEDGTGLGRLIHPVLGVMDYTYMPDEWINIDGDVIVPPIWESSKTLSGGQHTLWRGHMSDVHCIESWNSDASMPLPMLRQLISFWVNPPDPTTEGYIEWHPSYTTNLKFKVLMTKIEVNGSEVSLSYFSRQDWVEGTVAVTFKVVDYA